MEWTEIVTAVFGVLATFLGVWLVKLRKVLAVAGEVLDVPYAIKKAISTANKALEDQTLTKEEVREIADAFKEVLVQFDEAKVALGLGKKDA